MKDKKVADLLKEYASQLVTAVSDSHTRIQRNEENIFAPVLEVVQKLTDDAEAIEEASLKNKVNKMSKSL